MKDFVISKMAQSTFDDEEAMLEFLEYDYKILGDKDAFIVYYYLKDGIVWVHFLWANKKKKMLDVCKKLWAESVETDSIILFDCDDIAKMFGNHSRRVFTWTKELL